MTTGREPDRIVWHTSSYSCSNGDCVQVGWHTSSYSCGNGDCVQVAPAPDQVRVRDSKDPAGPALTFPSNAWRAFLTTVTPDPAMPTAGRRARLLVGAGEFGWSSAFLGQFAVAHRVLRAVDHRGVGATM